LTFAAEDRVARDHADMDAFAVEYISVHGRPPIEVPHGKGCACWVAIARQIALGLFALRAGICPIEQAGNYRSAIEW